MDDRHARHRRPDADRRRRPSDGHRSRSRSRFDRLIADAAAGLPPALRSHLADVDVVVREIPPPDTEPTLGRYEPASGQQPGTTATAGRVTLYRRPLELRARSKPDLVDLVRETLLHELADHLGIDDDGIEELGW